MSISIASALREGAEILDAAGVVGARREASGLLEHVIARDRTFLLAYPETLVTSEQLQIFREFVLRRSSGEPLQYITAQQNFFGLNFEVAPGVLIPRPETELLVETALELLSNSPMSPTLCDVGTGSGCIAITLLHERPDAHAFAIDISATALAIARRNARSHAVAARLNFVQADCFSSLSSATVVFDMIVSNPPYVNEPSIAGLQREVRDHEPREALAGGPDGLDVVRCLLNESAPFLKSGGYLLIEIGVNQAEAVKDLPDEKVWRLLEIRRDLQGIPRLVVLKKK